MVAAGTGTAGAADVPEGRPARHPRITSIDLLRGLVIALMALDHTRDFFGSSGQSPRDVSETALFLTRWITHLCAPTFVLLAGLSSALSMARGRSAAEQGALLFKRGLWIVFVEFTLVSFGWNLTWSSGLFIAQVMWVIGVSMMILAGLVFLPRPVIAAIALALIGGHNLLDGVHAARFGGAGWIWNLLHEPAMLHLGEHVRVQVLYPLIPWPGVMALGFVLGPLFTQANPTARFRWLTGMGLAMIAGFLLLRIGNLYGDPVPWTTQATPVATLLSVLDCEKYPPSLLFLLMTLGPAFLLLAWLEGREGRWADVLLTFGRVPFLFYVLHIPLIHALAVLDAALTIGQTDWLFGAFVPPKPSGYGLGLPGVYLVWLGVMLALFPVCRWFARLKATRHDWWLSYL